MALDKQSFLGEVLFKNENKEKQGEFLQQKEVDINGQKFWIAIFGGWTSKS